MSIQVSDGNGGVINHDYTLVVSGADLVDSAYMGTEFWIPRFTRVTGMQVIISSEVNTTGTVDILSNVGQGVIPFSTQAGQITTIMIPKLQEGSDYGRTSGIRNRLLQVNASDPISVRVLYYATAASEAILAFPVRSFGTEYIISTLGDESDVYSPRAVIVANEDLTQVTITAGKKQLEVAGRGCKSNCVTAVSKYEVLTAPQTQS